MSDAEHPDFAAESDYIAHAYDCLDRSRESAQSITGNVESGAGGTHQARYERDVLADKVRSRLEDLDIGDQSLIFGRIDLAAGDDYHIGRVAVFDEERNPMVVDWRAPIAESFYRATGRQTMGLTRRRHFITRYRELLGIEDEYFTGEGEHTGLKGERTLVAALESGRTGRLGDIVGTIQGEQDEIIRAPLAGAVIVQGGPGTGKTVVALHRAAYLLYTHRFPLAGQGVLVIGPNRLFLTYIEQVLPSLGESGVELTVLGDFVPGARVRGNDPSHIARVKGDLRMLKVMRRVVRQRQRALRSDLVVTYGVQRLRFSVADSEELIDQTRRRARFHNHGRKFVVEALYEKLAANGRYDVDPEELKDNLHGSAEIREALEWMWPVITAEEMLHDFYGFRSLLRAAGERDFGAEIEQLYRPRVDDVDDLLWTAHDVPLIDELNRLVGPASGSTKEHTSRTYGHIVIDEAQDLSPMQLHMVARRSLGGSMTIVGDIAQATSAWAHDSWESVTEHLPTPKGITRHELTVGYRLPGPLMDLAAKVLAKAMPDLKAPVAVRSEGDPPRFVVTDPENFGTALADAVAHERAAIGAGNIAIICATGAADDVSAFLDQAGIDHGVAYAGALEKEVSVIEVSMVKGLELDAAIVIEPDSIVEYEPQGLRSLYVAITRATRRLTIVDTGDSANVLA